MTTTTTRAQINFLTPLPLYAHEKPFQLFLDTPPSARKTNLVFEAKEVPVHNIRGGHEDAYTLDGNGFMYTRLDGFEDLNTAEEVRGGYLPAVERLLRSCVKGVERVWVFDWRVSCFLCFFVVGWCGDVCRRTLLSTLLYAMYPGLIFVFGQWWEDWTGNRTEGN
jgi:hypothetical protein